MVYEIAGIPLRFIPAYGPGVALVTSPIKSTNIKALATGAVCAQQLKEAAAYTQTEM